MRKTVAGTPADPTVEFAELDLDGAKYRLILDFNAIAEAEHLTGCNLLQGMAGFVLNRATAEQFRGLFFASLHKFQPTMTIEDAGKLIDVQVMFDIHQAMVRAYNVSMPEKKRMSVAAADPEV